MFSYLLESVFPAVGDFFMNLIAVSGLKPSALLNAMEYQLEFPEGSPIYLFLEGVNFWTGKSGFTTPVFYGIEFSMGWLQTTWGRALGVPLYTILSFFFAPALNYPMWVALPVCFAIYGLVFSVIKFLIEILIGILDAVIPF